METNVELEEPENERRIHSEPPRCVFLSAQRLLDYQWSLSREMEM